MRTKKKECTEKKNKCTRSGKAVPLCFAAISTFGFGRCVIHVGDWAMPFSVFLSE